MTATVIPFAPRRPGRAITAQDFEAARAHLSGWRVEFEQRGDEPYLTLTPPRAARLDDLDRDWHLVCDRGNLVALSPTRGEMIERFETLPRMLAAVEEAERSEG